MKTEEEIIDQEIWVPVKGHDRFEVSNTGKVRSVIRIGVVRFKIIKSRLSNNGYYRICLCTNSKRTYFSIHRLVALHFVPNPTNLPIVNHVDSNKQNNRAENLEWCTNSHNILHSFARGTHRRINGEDSHNSKLTNNDIISIKMKLRSGARGVDIAREFNVAPSTICDIKNGRKWAHIKL